ncbi:HlyU family transcriptional regulator [Pseudaestuariivita sp.]|uniref:HlyU family transcriptional regulator n=1 Tax=Pseudaestuariivita sp. TaxID=2211669 RepID=UPI00405A4B39
MSLLSKLFGGKSEPEAEPPASYDYKGYTITPDPVRDGGKWRVGARIDKEIAGEAKSHSLIRADLFDDADQAKAASKGKAELMIDQLGDTLFRT